MNVCFLKERANDTIYVLADTALIPSHVFGLGKYAYPDEAHVHRGSSIQNALIINFLTGTLNHFFYNVRVPDIFPRPKVRPTFNPITNKYGTPLSSNIYGIYYIETKTNILLDTNDNLEQGIINDINGGLSFFPRYYTGNNAVVDIWDAEKMKEILTDEYFATQTIKDKEAHQKLKALLTNLREDDNPVVVIAKLK